MADLAVNRISKKTGEPIKSIRVPSDFQNTAYSPIHDRPGTRNQMFSEGTPAEFIDSQSVADYEAQQGDEETNDSESWKYD